MGAQDTLAGKLKALAMTKVIECDAGSKELAGVVRILNLVFSLKSIAYESFLDSLRLKV